MCHAIVGRKITAAFAGLSAGRIDAIDELAPNTVHYLVRTPASSGTGGKLEAIAAP
jgi:hypothetical protein